MKDLQVFIEVIGGILVKKVKEAMVNLKPKGGEKYNLSKDPHAYLKAQWKTESQNSAC